MDLLEKLSTYVRVLEAGSMSAAARQLRISGPAVSRQIAALEAEIGVPLVARTTRRMEVTPAGRQLYERSLRILREVDEARALARGETIAGPLRVSAPITFGLAFLTPRLRTLRRRHPGLRLDLSLEDRLVDLALEGVDVAIRVGGRAPDSVDLVAHEIHAFRRVLVASPTYLKKRGAPRSPEALVKHEVLAYPMPYGDVWTLTDGARDARVRLDPIFRSNAMHALRALAEDDAGITLLPDWFVADEVARGTLRVVLPAWRTDRVVVLAIHRTAQRGAPRIRALLDHLRDR